MTTTTSTKHDSQIKSDVLNELKWDPTVDETEVGIQVRAGLVTLSGEVSSYPKRLAAREAAHRVHGVLDVVDNMKVRIPAGWARTDQDIARAIRHCLEWDVLVPDERVASTVSDGVVTLEGSVDTLTPRIDTERAVQRITGVREVINHITVLPRPADPGLIKEQIEGALERQAQREARRIGIDVHGGVVTLTGSIRSWSERNVIERVAGAATGVHRIDDRTVVDPYC